MSPRRFAGLATAAVCTLFADPSFADPQSTQPNVCLAVANAKYLQWKQKLILVNEEKTFANGSTKDDVLVVSPNTAYKLHRNHWHTAAVTLGQREAPSPDVILTNMNLGACSQSETTKIGDVAATLFTYDYKPDDKGFVAHGKIWISVATGLPLKQELDETAPPANAMVATAITSSYTYNGDVKIPRGAELAESNRLFGAWQTVRGLQGAYGGSAGIQ